MMSRSSRRSTLSLFPGSLSPVQGRESDAARVFSIAFSLIAPRAQSRSGSLLVFRSSNRYRSTGTTLDLISWWAIDCRGSMREPFVGLVLDAIIGIVVADYFPAISRPILFIGILGAL